MSHPFSNDTLHTIANALIDDAILYILDDQRYHQFFQEILPDAIRAKLGDMDEKVINELSEYIFERITLFPHSPYIKKIS